MLNLQELTVQTFVGHIGSAFRIAIEPAGVLAVELIDAESLSVRNRPTAGASMRAPFNLLFRGPMSPVLPQRIYRFEHDSIGTFELFIVPIGPDAIGMRYEAIFN